MNWGEPNFYLFRDVDTNQEFLVGMYFGDISQPEDIQYVAQLEHPHCVLLGQVSAEWAEMSGLDTY